jgi:hypothetical protein
MRVIAVIDQREVVERILCQVALCSSTPLLAPARSPPADADEPWTREPCDDVDPMPDYKTSSPTEYPCSAGGKGRGSAARPLHTARPLHDQWQPNTKGKDCQTRFVADAGHQYGGGGTEGMPFTTVVST